MKGSLASQYDDSLLNPHEKLLISMIPSLHDRESSIQVAFKEVQQAKEAQGDQLFQG